MESDNNDKPVRLFSKPRGWRPWRRSLLAAPEVRRDPAIRENHPESGPREYRSKSATRENHPQHTTQENRLKTETPENHPQTASRDYHFKSAIQQSQPPDTILCAECEILELKGHLHPRELRGILYKIERYSTTETFPRRATTTASCPFCRLMAHSLGGDSVVTQLTYEDLGYTRTLSGRSTISLCVRPWNESGKGNRIAPLGGDSIRVASHIFSYPRRLVSPHVADRDTMKNWISRSMNLEGSGKSSIPYARSQKYLIDVQDMCIVDVEESAVSYLALSYVWGNVQSLQLLRSNKALLFKPGHLKENVAALAPVIQDAIQFTGEMSYRYLWVDSLCITQDDAENKHSQIFNMNRIYLEADITLVAAHNGNLEDGLPGVRPYKSPRTQHIERVLLMDMAVIFPDISESQSVYFDRAWTYQEERLSRRLFFFTEVQVYFSDLWHGFSEDKHEDDPNCNSDSTEYRLGDPFMRGGVLLGQLYPSSKIAWWKQSVETYSKRSLSFQDDRYNAYRGIEMELKQRWHYSCLRGLPLSDFIYGLFWEHGVSVPRTGSVRIHTLPSWSWCGWTGEVAYPRWYVYPAVTALEAVDGGTIWTWKPAQGKVTVNLNKDVWDVERMDYEEMHTDKVQHNVGSSIHVDNQLGEFQTHYHDIIHQSISATLVLRFNALSALVDVEFRRMSGTIPSYQVVNPQPDQCEIIDLYHVAAPFPITLRVECIVLGMFENDSNLHHHFTPASEQETILEKKIRVRGLRRERREDTQESSSTDIGRQLATLVIAYPMDSLNWGSTCERVGTLHISSHCFFSLAPRDKGG